MSDRTKHFEVAMLPYLNAAYNLARWLLRDRQKAEDAVQDAYLKAFMYFDSFRDGDAKPWLLGIVRNCCFTQIDEERQRGACLEFIDDSADASKYGQREASVSGPEQLVMLKYDVERIDKAIEELPTLFREVVVLREIEDLSYDQIAKLIDVPIGTVMSRLARARAALRAKLTPASRRTAP